MKRNLYPGLKGWNRYLFGALTIFVLNGCFWQGAHATVIIDSTAGGGFESGSSLAANGWTAVNNASSTMNNWYVGTASGSGSNFCYISNTGGSTHNYDITTTSIVHFYRSVTVPAGETNIQLSFLLKSVGELNNDGLVIYIGTGALTAGSLPGSGYSAIFTQNSTTTWAGYQDVYRQLSPALAGTTFNIVFTWKNNASGGAEPPASVDNVSLISHPCVVSSYPWTEGFETMDTLGAGVVPPCWGTQDNSSFNWTTAVNGATMNAGYGYRGAGAHTGTHYLYSTYSSDAWVFTPPMQFTGGTTYYFYYYYTPTDNIMGFTITTAVGTSQTSAAMTTTLITYISPVNTSYKLALCSYTPSTSGTYNFGIHSVCTNPPYFFDIDDVSVATASPCVLTTLPWSEGFESNSTGTSVLPPCWLTQLNSGTDWTGANAAVSNGIGAHSGTNYLYAHPSSDSWAFSPGMALTGGTTYYFSYYYTATANSTGYTITTGVGTSQSSAGMTTTLGTLTNPVNTAYQQAVYSFTPSVTGTYYFGIHSAATSSSANFNIDDINLSTIAPCTTPVSSFPWTEGFESVTPETGNVPSCWGTQIVSGTNWVSANTSERNGIGSHSGTHFLYSNGSSNVWAYTPGMQLTGGTTYYFNYYYTLTDGSTTGYTITTAVGSSQTSTAMTTTIGTITNPSGQSYRVASYSYTPSTSGVYYFGINSSCSNATAADFNLDDISITTSAICGISSFPWSEGFETTPTGTSNTPSCWLTQLGSGPQDWVCANAAVRNGIGSHSGTNYLYSHWSGDTWLFAPAMQLTGGTTYYFSYYYAETDANILGYTITTSVGTAQNSSAMTTTLNVLTTADSSAYRQAVFPYTPATTGTYYFGIHSSCPTSAPGDFNIDDVAVQTNSCLPPTPIAPTPVTSTSVDANWTCTGCTGSYIVEYGALANFTTPGTGSSPGPNGNVISVPAGTFSTLINGLTAGSEYRYFVRQNCGSGYSVNYGSEVFSSSYCTPQYSSGCGNGDAIVNFQLSNLTDATAHCNLAINGTNNYGYGDFTSSEPTINLTAGVQYTWSLSINYTYGHYIKMWIDMDNSGSFDNPEDLLVASILQTPCGTQPCVTTGTFTIPPSTAIAGNHRMRVRENWSSPADYGPCDNEYEGETADYMVNLTVPTCPVPTATAATSLTLNSAQANWTCTGCTGAYIVEYGPAGFTPGTGSANGTNGTLISVAAGNTSVTITGLTQNTQYTYYIRENCTSSGVGYSLNSGAENFTTLNPLTVGTIVANQQTVTTTVGASNANIWRLDIPVAGTLGTLALNSIKFTSENTTDADVAASGVQLWTGTTAGPTSVIGAAQTFSSGAVTFSGLSLNLPAGTTYLWLTYNVSSSATLGDFLDAKMNAGDITITPAGGAAAAGTQPSLLLDPAGNVLIDYCNSGNTNLYSSGCTHSDDLTTFAVANLNNTTSGCSVSAGGAGYANFTTTRYDTINLVQGATYTWTAEVNYSYGHSLQMWIDLNNNGGFESGEALLSTPYNQPNTGGPINVPFGSSFTIPSSTQTGYHRFRVRLVWPASSSFGACDALYEGTIEDYTCYVAAPNCPVPTSVAASSIDLTTAQTNWTCTGCSGGFIVEYGPTATFTTPGTGTAPGTNGTIATALAGSTSLVITGLSQGVQYTYYVRQDCSASSNGYSVNSAPQTFTTLQQLTLNTIIANQQTVSTTVGALNANIWRLDFPVVGTTGTLTLNSVKFNSENTTDADVTASGIKIWTGTTTGPTSQVGTAQTFASGSVTFSGLNLNLATGTTYLWLTYNVTSTATIGDVLDAFVNAGDINVSAGGLAISPGTQPPSTLDPAGNVLIDYCNSSNTNLYSSGCTHSDDLTTFAVANLNNTTSGCSVSAGGSGYANFTLSEPVINFIQGTTYTWTAEVNYSYGHSLQMWIDFNNDGTFEGSDALLSTPYNQPNTGGPINVPFGSSFTIPSNAQTGNHRFRVRLVWPASSSFGACDALYEGTIEDYTCNITAPNCPVPTSVAASSIGLASAQANWTCSGCTGTYIVEYGPTGFTPGTGTSNGTNGTIVDVSAGNTSVTINGLSQGTTYDYYVREDCSGSGNGYSVNSPPQTFTTFQQLTLGAIVANQQTVSTTVGAPNANIWRLDLPVAGTMGTLTFNSIKFTSENTTDADVAASGVKLWTGTTAGPSSQIGTAQSFASGAVTFSGLNLNLAAGTTYLWLTYNVSSSATLGDALDANVNAGDITITAGGSALSPGTQPTALLDPAGNVLIDYCDNYIYTTGCNDNDALMSFSISNLNDASIGCQGNVSNTPNSGYGNFTSSQPTINLVQGGIYSWTASINYSGNHWLQMWIDLNNDGLFESSEALLSTPFAQPALAAPATFGSTFTLSPTATTGTHRFRVREVWATPTFDACTQYQYGEAIDYLCNITAVSMVYVSSTTTQDNSPVVPGTTNQQMIGLQVVTSGSTSPMTLSSINFNTTGTTNSAIDIANARVYYTGASSTFATTNQFGSTVASLNGSYTVSGSQVMAQGTNYFWLTYDVPAGAALNDYAYGAITSFVLSGVSETPSNTSSAIRQIQYCAPTPYVDCNTSPDGGISLVRLNTINNSSGCSVSGDYTNYTVSPTTTQTTTLTAGQNYTIIVDRGGSTTVSYTVKVWIDFNQDGIFTNASPELIYSFTSTSAAGFSGSFQVPLTAASGEARMRVRMARNVDDACDNPGCVSCGTNYGETEDYEVNICVPPAITVQPAGIAACAGSPFTLSVTATGTTPTYQWQKGISNISAATSATYTVNSAGPGDAGSYSVVINNACGTVTSNPPAVVTVGACNLTWTGATSTDWFDATNWSPQIVPNSCGAAVTIDVVTGNMPVITGADVSVGNVNIAAGDSITLDRQILSVCGNWTGSSGANASVDGTGTLMLSGTTAQTISGHTRFNILEVNNTMQNGVSLASNASVYIAGGLWLAQGNLDVTTGTLTLLSTSSSNNSYIDDFSFGGNPGTITGNVIAQRYVPVQGSNQHYISSPVSTPTFSQLSASGPDGSYIIPSGNCSETQSSNLSPYGTMFQYNDGHVGSGQCMLGNWEIRSSGNTVNGVGYSTYLTGNTTLSLTSTANTGNINVSTFNSAFPSVPTFQQIEDGGNGAIESGWALVGNPYPSALDLTVDRTTYGYDDQVQVWKTSGPFAGTWQATTITGEPGTVVIPPFQAFMVHVSTVKTRGNYTYPFFQSERTRTTNLPFYRSQNQNTLQLLLDYNGMQDITTVSFNPSATNGFDPAYDAVKQDGAANNPTLYTFFPNATTWYAINTVPSLTQTATVPMGLRPVNTGTMTISPQGIESFDPTTYIYLEDKQTGIWVNLRNGAYTFTTTPNDNQQRFVLHFTPPTQILTTDATCEAGGMINITQPGAANWNYMLADVNNATLSTGSLNASTPVNVNVEPGVYTLTLTDNTGYTVVKNIQVGGAEVVSAAFSSNLNTAQVQQNITFTGNTPDATTYNWNFGDGNTATGQTAVHNFQQEGTYNVLLNVSSAAGCTSPTTHSVTITSRSVTGITNLNNASEVNIWSNENRVFIDFSKLSNVDADISMYNVLGQLINHETFGRSTLYSHEITNLEAAYIIVKVINENQVTTKKVFIANNK